jgi:hypothetical protein
MWIGNRKNMRRKTILFTLGSALAVAMMLGPGPVPAQAADKKPNIVFILTDNLGYGELGVYGGGILRGAPTPRIDKLASEGMRLLNFNVEAQCTPSRSALMTGRFSIRSGMYEVPRDWCSGKFHSSGEGSLGLLQVLR